MLDLDFIIKKSLEEDIKEGDHTTLAIIPEDAIGSARLLVKDTGILAGIEVARRVYQIFDPELEMKIFIKDGERISHGDIAFEVIGRARSILQTERLVLNILQRMSGIATQTRKYVDAVQGTKAVVLDTRKTSPCRDYWEKWRLRLAGDKIIVLDCTI
jgi:nicotinate-nucleotide pyrophosphorylase (carboxylating)